MGSKNKKSILQHIYEHPFGLIVYGKNEKWYSFRPMGKDSYWIENEQGEGTEVKQYLLFEAIDILFKKVF